MSNERLDFLVEKLGCSLSEAADVVASDKAIDKGADPYPLSKEQKQAVRKATQTTSGKPRPHNWKRKANHSKQKIILTITKALEGMIEQLEVVNCERELTFVYKDVKYKIVLSCPRK